MNLEPVEKIAEAVLYEGYMLYPYRPSSVKNQRRWNFGVLCPQSYCERQPGSDAWTMQTECLVRTSPSTHLTVKVRFLQIVRRTVGALRNPGRLYPESAEPQFDPVDRLEVGNRTFQSWDEAVEREHTFTLLEPTSLAAQSPLQIEFPSGRTFEYLCDDQRQAVGAILREWQHLTASIEFAATPCRDHAVKATVRIANLTPMPTRTNETREDALPFSLASAHTILAVEHGEFLSLLDPPAEFTDLAAACSNIGTWPVLAGNAAETMLSSPIILYDHPQIAPESAGNLFDSTEIDEILSLRILTLTDDEKREMSRSDDRTREILERTENMPDEQFLKLHGVLRGLTPHKEVA